MEQATFVQRFLANFVDGWVFIGLLIVAEQVIGMVLGALNQWISFGLYVVLLCCYFIFPTLKFGMTLGKRLMRIRVTGLDNEALTLFTVVKREVFKSQFVQLVLIGFLIGVVAGLTGDDSYAKLFEALIMPIGSILLICDCLFFFFRSQKRALHDFFGGTIVVQAKQ